jgi:acetyl-CoA/propionyl-CoA carboxylase biotin carboxyl carrier protein
MFRKVLIANRGEIAMRVARTCRRLGIRTVAIFSDADRDAPHVAAADEAVRVGPADPSQSYLSVERVVAAAKESGAEALHPGYGFLSERAELAAACAAAQLTFVGPTEAAMRALGDKIGARRLASQHGIPVVPGYDGDDQTDRRLAVAAQRVGFPFMIKAAAGGGGRGMRLVARQSDLIDAASAARREALQAFGDGRLLLETLITPARHVEVQLLADRGGNALAVGDRECSLQRRHQKVIEEAPAPALSDGLRRSLWDAAERLATSAGYEGAGTVEFLVQDEAFYFLEVNARLQVEHTVTEMVTGLDLVEWQLRLAAGERLTLGRATCRVNGHAVQARVYAERPEAGFLPAAGRLRLVRWPEGPHVRVDGSVLEAGQVVPPEYDPLLGKVICWGHDRAQALARLDSALLGTTLLGVPTNVAFLRRLLASAPLRAGPVHTTFLNDHPELQIAGVPPRAALAAAARRSLGGNETWRALAGWCPGGQRRLVRLRDTDSGHRYTIDAASPADKFMAHVELATGEEPGTVEVGLEGERWRLAFDVPRAPNVGASGAEPGSSAGSVTRPAERRPSAEGNWFVDAPLPGRVSQVLVYEGQELPAGAAVASVEAMKIQHSVSTPRAAKVVALLAPIGEFIRAGDPIAELAPVEGRR